MLSRLFLLLFLSSSLSWANSNYISLLGNDILQKSELVVLGRPFKVTPLVRTGQVVRFEITDVYWGRSEIGRKVNVFYYFLSKKITPEEQAILFLKPLSTQNTYEVVREITNQDKYFASKQKSLRKLLMIESLSSDEEKKRQLVNFCASGLASQDSWTRWNALHQWEYLVQQKKYIAADELQKIIISYKKIPELSLKSRLSTSIIKVKRRLDSSQKKLPIANRVISPPSVHEEEIKKTALKLQKANSLEEQIKAITILASYPSPISRQAFVTALNSPSLHIRSLSLFYLRLYGTSAEIAPIWQCLEKESSGRVCKNALQALVALGEQDIRQKAKKYLSNPYIKAHLDHLLP